MRAIQGVNRATSVCRVGSSPLASEGRWNLALATLLLLGSAASPSWANEEAKLLHSLPPPPAGLGHYGAALERYMAEERSGAQGQHPSPMLGLKPEVNERELAELRPQFYEAVKRDPYSFGLGKRWNKALVYRNEPGKRDPYAFGLGKRSRDIMIDEDGQVDFDDGGNRMVLDDEEVNEVKRDDPYAFGLGKRDPYAFGLGKRDPYAFGLGKRAPYSFGLGKRTFSQWALRSDRPYSFGLGRK